MRRSPLGARRTHSSPRFLQPLPCPIRFLSDTTGAADTLANLAAAINGTAGAGTTYSTGTVANASVTATAGATTLSLSASAPGSTGNSIATTTTMANGHIWRSHVDGRCSSYVDGRCQLQ